MRREDFDHVIRAAAAAVGLDEFVIIGSQAIHGQVSEPPEELLVSMEVDMYPLADPSRADEIDRALGDGSWFERTNGTSRTVLDQRPQKPRQAGWTVSSQ
jgi:hypothetical protein